MTHGSETWRVWGIGGGGGEGRGWGEGWEGATMQSLQMRLLSEKAEQGDEEHLGLW